MPSIKTNVIHGKLDWFPEVDVEQYGELYKQGKSMSMEFEEVKSQKSGERTPYCGMTKAEVLKTKAELRRKDGYAPPTAFEEALSTAGIKVTGSFADPISKFYEFSDTRPLFPEFVADRVYAGLLKNSLVPEFVMAETVIDSTTFQKIYLQDDEDDRQLKNVAKRSELPETVIEVGSQVVRLDMYGRYVKMSKIDMKQQRANVFGKFMERVGQQIQIDQTDLMFYRLINGDGNSGSTPQTTVTAAATGAGELSLNDAINWALGAPTPYVTDKFVMRKANLVKWYGRLYDASTTSVPGKDDMVVFPKAYEWDKSTITTNYAWGVDSNYAVEMITNGGPQVDAENLVREVSEGTAIWMMYEFAIADGYAVTMFDLSS